MSAPNEDVDMDMKQHHVNEFLRTHKKCSFKELLEKQNSKMEVIVTFMLVLEMMKMGKILIEQENLFDDIFITVNPDADLTETVAIE